LVAYTLLGGQVKATTSVQLSDLATVSNADAECIQPVEHMREYVYGHCLPASQSWCFNDAMDHGCDPYAYLHYQ
jgi:hypothetical protein